MQIFEEIVSKKDLITEQEIEQAIPKIMEVLDSNISKYAAFAFKVNGTGPANLGKMAFREYSKDVIRKALISFCIKKKHWNTERDLSAYIKTSIKRFSYSLHDKSLLRTSTPYCPACKSISDSITLLEKTGKLLHCQECTAKLEHASNKKEQMLREVFRSHSRRGCKCPSCSGFLPDSYIGTNSYVVCLYCDWFGVSSELEKRAHPVKQHGILTAGLSFADGSHVEIQDYNIASTRPDSMLEARQNISLDYKLVEQVLTNQMKVTASVRMPRVIKKVLMFKAFLKMLELDPHDMIAYLCYQKSRTDEPLHSRIFQEFFKLLENALPFDVLYKGKETRIYSWTDKRLNMFCGKYSFKAIVPESMVIKNMTKERYVGSKDLKDYGRCFIGYIESAIGSDGVDYTKSIEKYGFSFVKFKDIPVGTYITITHYALDSHYEKGMLLHLQRIRRSVVDSIYKKRHGTRRILNTEKECAEES